MTIQELIQSPDSPLSQMQREVLEEEYNDLLLSIKEKGEKLEKANADVFCIKKDIEEENERKCKAINEAVGCLNAVRAMLVCRGATHRQRNFYADAMVKYIDGVVASMEIKKDPYAF